MIDGGMIGMCVMKRERKSSVRGARGVHLGE